MPVQQATKPPWLRVKLPSGENYRFVRRVIDENRLHTVCESAHCPNMGECWGAGTATVMILGNICTRSCGFCAVLTGRPTELDWEEPERVARAVELMRLQHCVITSVNRDELKDGGAEIWARTIRAIKARSPNTTIEVLLPDFKGDWAALDRVLEERPDVVSHNMETVKRLYRQVRPQAKYERSLDFIRHTKAAGLRTKSGAMLGLGEAHEEVLELMQDLLDHGCEVLTLGQYLQPTAQHLPVVRFLPPEEFETYRQIGLEMGFDYVESGPLVRSSYHSERHVKPRQQR